MKSKLLLLLSFLTLVCTSLASPAMADEAGGDMIGTSKKFGVGVGSGNHGYGLSGKYYLSAKDAVQGVVAIYPGVYGSDIDVGVDYLREVGTWVNVPVGRLWWGLGAGAEAYLYKWWNSSYTSVGVVGLFEVGWHFKNIPVELTANLRPTFFLGSDHYGGLYLYGGGSARWYF